MSELTLDNRHTIVPGQKILGGVFLGRAAIVVDYEENPEPYEAGFKAFKNSIDADDLPLRAIVRAVTGVVDTLLPMEPSVMFKVLRREAEARGVDRVDRSHAIGLSAFIAAGGGYCQHRALFGGALLELFEVEEHMGGEVSINEPFAYDWNDDRHIDTSYVLGGIETVLSYASVRSVVIY